MGLVFVGCTESEQEKTVNAPQSVELSETERMVQTLRALASQRRDPQKNSYLNSMRADIFMDLSNKAQDRGQQVMWRIRASEELINSGRELEAVALLEPIISMADQGMFGQSSEAVKRLYRLLGIAHMRNGETTNCRNNHTSESCILPFSAKARHTDPTGSTEAKRVYAELLSRFPDDLVAKWLLNIAYMTLGEYPDGVPPKWRIPESAFRSDIELPPFIDRATGAGVGTSGLSGGSCVDDFNNDGLLDIVVSSWGAEDQMRIYLNDGQGSFHDHTGMSGLMGITGGLNMVHADYDNDGDNDILVLRGAWLSSQGKHPNSLLRNEGDGTFVDVTRSSGIYSEHPTQTAAWGDYNNDGHLDLFIGNESDSDDHPCELYRNNGDATFTNVAAEVGVDAVGYFKGVSWGDIDNDGDIDIYLSNLKGGNKLYINQGAENNYRFEEVAESRGVQYPINSFPTWFWDYDNDGWLDLFTTTFPLDCYGEFSAEVAAYALGQELRCELPKLYRNRGDGTFEDITVDAGLDRPLFAMGSNYGDADGDGRPDMYLGTGEPDFQSIIPNKLLMNRSDRFKDATSSSGTGHLQKGHGVAFADIDNDGDQDIYINLGGAYEGDIFNNALFENPGSGNNWVTLQLHGIDANRNGIGARIEAVCGNRTFHHLVGTGGSFGANPLRAEIGLGVSETIDTLRITWPGSGTVQEFVGVATDRFYQVKEHRANLEELDFLSVDLGTGSGDNHHHHEH